MQVNLTLNEEQNKIKRQLVAYRDHSNAFNCQIKIPEIFEGLFGNFHGISKHLLILQFLVEPHTMFCRALVGEH